MSLTVFQATQGGAPDGGVAFPRCAHGDMTNLARGREGSPRDLAYRETLVSKRITGYQKDVINNLWYRTLC
jgi:hypothetical protein